jgi:hypothetical protein
MLTWPWAEESEGEKESAARWPTPFETEAGEAGEGWGSRVWHRVEEEQGRERGDRVQQRGPERHGQGGSRPLRQGRRRA